MDLWMKYRRLEQQYDASFSFDAGDPIDKGVYDWHALLRKLATFLSAFPQLGLVLHRTDHAYAVPSRIGDAETQLFRTDPVQAIRNWTHQNFTITNPMAPIPAGYEVLPDVFGDVTYVKRQGRAIECPTDGNNLLLLDDGENDDASTLRFFGAPLPIQFVSEHWATCKTADLLAIPTDKFFLPRAWNASPPWISHEALDSRYNKYLEEKSKAQ